MSKEMEAYLKAYDEYSTEGTVKLMSYIDNLRKWWAERMTYYPPQSEEQRTNHERVNEIIENAG